MTKEKSSAASYRQLIASRQEIIDVTLPSGAVFQMKRPNSLGYILGGDLPVSFTNDAISKWSKQGVTNLAEEDKTQEEIIQMMFRLRDRVLELSHNPKIVIGDPQNENELSASEIEKADLEFLLMWVAQGGETANRFSSFPGKPSESFIVSPSRKKLRKVS